MKAIISDIHGNLEALQAVLDDIELQGINSIYCLGDIIGYGPNQGECIDLVIQHCDLTIMGNHEADFLSIINGKSSDPDTNDFFYYNELEESNEYFEHRYQFISSLPKYHAENGCLYVHGSARDTQNEYVLPADVHDEEMMSDLFSRIEKLCFQGHTHIPGVFTERRNFIYSEGNRFAYPITNEKMMICVGSVGQPRDGNRMACYVIHTNHEVVIRRVSYDYGKTIKKMKRRIKCNDFFASRLAIGR